MDECALQRQRLSEEFQSNRKVFLALGDETRQQILIALLENEKIGMRVPEITVRTHLSRPAVSHHLRDSEGRGPDRDAPRRHAELLLCGARTRAAGAALKALVDHVDSVVRSAAANAYPRLREEERTMIRIHVLNCGEVGVDPAVPDRGISKNSRGLHRPVPQREAAHLAARQGFLDRAPAGQPSSSIRAGTARCARIPSKR
jgi:ArsR family transcriptional regulator